MLSKLLRERRKEAGSILTLLGMIAHAGSLLLSQLAGHLNGIRIFSAPQCPGLPSQSSL